jgi:hypothetical protein
MQSESKDHCQASKGSNYCMTIPGPMSIQTHVTSSNSPYLLDLAPSDYWLFDYIKQHLVDEKDSNSLLKSVTDYQKKAPIVLSL